MEDIEKKLYEINGQIASLKTDNHNLHCRISEIKEKLENQAEFVESVHTMANELVHMREDFNRMDTRVSEMEKKPGKRWELVITVAITALVSGLVGFLVNTIIG